MLSYSFTICVIGLDNISDIITTRHDVVWNVVTLDTVSNITVYFSELEDFIRYTFISINNLKSINRCDGCIIIPINVNSTMRALDVISKIQSPRILAYPNESTNITVLEDMCTISSEYFLTRPMTTIIEMTRWVTMHNVKLSPEIRHQDLITIRIPKDITSYIDIDGDWLIRYHESHTNYIRYMIKTRLLGLVTLPLLHALPVPVTVLTIGSHDDVISINDTNSSHNTFMILLLIIAECNSVSCIHECNKLKSNYYRRLEKTLNVDRCIPVYDRNNIMPQIFSILCNGMDIDIISYKY